MKAGGGFWFKQDTEQVPEKPVGLCLERTAGRRSYGARRCPHTARDDSSLPQERSASALPIASSSSPLCPASSGGQGAIVPCRVPTAPGPVGPWRMSGPCNDAIAVLRWNRVPSWQHAAKTQTWFAKSLCKASTPGSTLQGFRELVHGSAGVCELWAQLCRAWKLCPRVH